MSTPASQSPVHPTRQQLDELEALMQRMLALPVQPSGDDGETELSLPSRPATSRRAPSTTEARRPREDEEPTTLRSYVWSEPLKQPTSLSARAEQHAATRTPEESFQSEETHEPAEEIAAYEAPAQPPPPVPAPIRWPLSAKPEAARPAEPARLDALLPIRPPVIVEPPDEPESSTAEAWPQRPGRLPVRGSWWLHPLFWSNRAFDRSIGYLGTPGRWLCSSQGRAFLGLFGLLMLAAALAWGLNDWTNWTWLE